MQRERDRNNLDESFERVSIFFIKGSHKTTLNYPQLRQQLAFSFSQIDISHSMEYLKWPNRMIMFAFYTAKPFVSSHIAFYLSAKIYICTS